MKTIQQLFDERSNRVMKAVNLEKTDRTPVILLADSYCASHMGKTIAEFPAPNYPIKWF